MVARGAGDVGCAHCTQFGANQTCRVCKLQVCDACAADWTTCNEQAARVLRLGMGWRVRDVDPKGRFALVSRALKIPRIVDLRQLKWLGTVPLAFNTLGTMAKFPPRLTSDQLLVHADVTWVTSDSMFVGLRYREMLGGAPDQVLPNVDGPLGGSTCVSAIGDKYAHVTDGQRVVVVEHSRGALPVPQAANVIGHGAVHFDPSLRYRAESYEPLPRKVVSAIHVDGERDRLASATWREIAVHRMNEGKLERLDIIDTGIDANITHLALTGRFLAYAAGSKLQVRAISEKGVIGDKLIYHLERPVHAMAMSRDGSYIAIGSGDTLFVHDLERDRTTQFEEHSDRINFIRFAADDHVMISADKDNRVVLRPRTPEGYAKPSVDVELAAPSQV